MTKFALTNLSNNFNNPTSIIKYPVLPIYLSLFFKYNSLISLYWSFGVFYSRGDRCGPPFLALMAPPCIYIYIYLPTPPSAVFSCDVIWFWDVVWWGLGCMRMVVDSGGVWSLACLTEEVQPCYVFPLGPMYADPVRRNSGSPYAAVSGAHQNDCNPTIDVPAHLRVSLLPLGGQETVLPLQGCCSLHPQQSIHRGNKRGEVSAQL